MISAIEAGRPTTPARLRCLYPRTGNAHVVGITGSARLGQDHPDDAAWRSSCGAGGRRVGIVAIDPTSPFTGGALLGDRIRMQELHSRPRRVHAQHGDARHARRPGTQHARRRPSARRLRQGHRARRDGRRRPGRGRDRRARPTRRWSSAYPGSGDDIQAIKAGILEIADILVVNKADLAGADRLAADLRAMQQLSEQPAWPVPIVRTVAIGRYRDARAALDRIADHRRFLSSSGRLEERRAGSARRQVRAIVEDRVQQRFEHLTHGPAWAERVRRHRGPRAGPVRGRGGGLARGRPAMDA